MKRFYYTILLIFVSVITFNCQKEISYSGLGVPSTGNNNASPVKATLQGNIMDETGQPATNVMVQVGDKKATTNADGYFRIVKASLDKNASLVIAEKAGYFKAFRSFNATSGANQVIIKLIKKSSAGIISATSGGSVTLSNGSKIALAANSVVKVSGGNAYTGSINVYAAYMDPTIDDIAQVLPGSFMANDQNNKRVTLASYGMLAIELESATGEKLQIAPGSTATLSTAIPSSIQSSAPATIALWYLDEQTGIWKEEGLATKNGNNYIGEVRHFSFWNCDIGIPAVTLSATFKNNEGIRVVHGLIRITSRLTDWPSQAYGWTDSLGQVSGLVPANENLVLEVLDLCNNVVFTQNIGQITKNTDLGIITVSDPNSSSVITIKGQLKDCSNEPVNNGYAIINCDNIIRYASVNNGGEFVTSFIRCSGGSTTCEVIGVNESLQQQGASVNMTITTPVTNTGNIIACGTSALQFINYTVDGANYSISSSANDSLSAYTYETQITPPFATWIAGSNRAGNDNIWLYFEHIASAGTYNVADFNVSNFDSIGLVRPFTVTISSYASSAGGFYEGTFSGQFKELGAPIPIHNVNGTFKIRR